MQKLLKVAQREYVETVKTKTFLLSLLFLPIIIGGVIAVSSWVSRNEGKPRPPLKVGVTCFVPELRRKLEAAFAEHNKSDARSPLVLVAIDPRTMPTRRRSKARRSFAKAS